MCAQFLPSGCFLFFLGLFGDAAQEGPKAPGGLTLTRAIGPQDIKLLNKLTSDPGGAGIFSSIGLTSCQLEELGRFNFNSWEDLVKKTGVTPETLKLIQETFRLHLVATAADGWVAKPCWVEKPSTSAAAAAAGLRRRRRLRLRGVAIDRNRVG